MGTIRYIVYLSNASQEQEPDSDALEGEERRNLMKLAGDEDLTVVDVIEEDFEAIKLGNRPGLQAAIRAIERSEANGILCEGLHRLGKSLPDFVKVINLVETGALQSIRTATSECVKPSTSLSADGQKTTSDPTIELRAIAARRSPFVEPLE